jgi:hypothetical protein
MPMKHALSRVSLPAVASLAMLGLGSAAPLSAALAAAFGSDLTLAQGNLTGVQRQSQAIDVQRGADAAAVVQRNDVQTRRSAQQALEQDLQKRERAAVALAAATRRQVQQALQRDAKQMPEATPLVDGGVDDSPLWNLLRAQRLMQFDQNLAAMRRRYPDWTPALAMLAERSRQQQDGEIETALVRANPTVVMQLVEQYPAQFSCARIDRLWRAAEILAKAEQPDEAMALYRQVFPDCTPAANRIATLYMVQQNIGADSDGMRDLVTLEAQHGQRDADSEAKFARLQYDRDLTRLATLAPDSTEALQLAQQMAAPIDSYRDGAAATLSGWIMLAHERRDLAESWFVRAQQWLPGKADAALGLLQLRLDQRDLAGAEALLQLPPVAADPRARPQRARLSMLRADVLNQNKDYAASLRELDQAERFGASAEQTAQLRGWNLYGSVRYEQASALFAAQYKRLHDAASAEGWALSENARGRLPELTGRAEAHSSPLQDYVVALQSQQLYYRKQFIDAYALQQRTEQSLQQLQVSDPALDGAFQKSVRSYLPDNLGGIDAASVTTGLTYSNHAGSSGQGHLETLAPAVRAEWIDGTRQYNLRYRTLMLDAGTVGSSAVASAIGAPAGYQASGKANAQELWFAIDDSLWLTGFGRINWQSSLGATAGGVGGSDLYGQLSVSQQTAWGSWGSYIGSNPVRDSLLSWRGMRLAGSDQVWGDVRRNTLGLRSLWQISDDWSVSANGELAQLGGQNVQSNRALALDLGAGYNLKPAGFDYLNIGPALHYLHYDNNQNQYDWGLGGYYSPQRSVSLGLASQFLTLEGRNRQWSGNFELGWNTASESAAACLPVALPASYASVNRSSVNCGYSGSSNSGIYGHVQFGMVQRLGSRWQLGVLGDVNVTPGRDRQYAAMLFLRYFFADRDAVFSRDLPKNTRDFYGQLDDGR